MSYSLTLAELISIIDRKRHDDIKDSPHAEPCRSARFHIRDATNGTQFRRHLCQRVRAVLEFVDG